MEMHLGIETYPSQKGSQGSHNGNETNNSVPALIPIESSKTCTKTPLNV